jgi:hypothetical protein
MKIAIIGILLATYLTFSYKCMSLIFYWREQLIEMSIISILAFSLLFSYNSETFVWMLVAMMCLHQIIQLTFEVSARLKRQKMEQTMLDGRIRMSA